MLTGAGFLAVTGVVVTYVAVFGWPYFALNGWDWLQGLTGWMPDLPGM
jgi:hypothetical protein